MIMGVSTPTSKRIALLFIGLMLAAQPVWAARLQLDNGARIVGDLRKFTTDKVIIGTDYAGKLQIARASVVGITTEEPYTVVLVDGVYVTGRLAPAPRGRLRLAPALGGNTRILELSQIKSIYQGDPLDELLTLDVNISVGVTVTSGNSDTKTLALFGELVARTPGNRFTLLAEYNWEKSNGVETRDAAFGFIKYDHFLSERAYLFTSATFERDDFADLNLRTSLALGGGYQFFDTESRSLYFEAGVAFINEDFEEAEDNSTVGGRYGLNFEQVLLEGIRFFHFQTGLFSADNIEDFTIRSRTGLRFDLTGQGLVATLAVNIDYVNQPAPGQTSTDKKYLLLLGYQF